MIFVPLNKKCFATSGCIALEFSPNRCRDPSVAGIFETGTDSPKTFVSTVACWPYGQQLHTCEHAFIDYAIACEQQAITRKLRQRWVRDFVYIPWHQLATFHLSPCIVSEFAAHLDKEHPQNPFRKTLTSHSKREMSRRRFMVYSSALP